MLGALADNGGPTLTHALLPGSPALDAGSTSETVDQRGVARPQDSADDIGAYESGCSSSPYSVSNESELNTAIACFNKETTPGTFTINISQSISLTASTAPINNSTSGVELFVNGNSHTVDAQGLPDVFAFYIQADTTVTIREITVTGGNTTGTGGTGGQQGAAVITVNGGTLTLAESTVTGNQGAFGGAINNARGTLTITDSTLNNNRATGGFLPLGGAIYSGGAETNPATVTVTNSTFSGNRSDVAGGAIYNSSDSNLNLDSVTIADNEAQNGGGIVSSTDTTVTMRNTIIANSVGGDCLPTGNAVINATYSLIEDGLSCVTGTNTNNKTGDPKLGPLANNGGPTQTRALLPGSPAIDAGDTALIDDQRGVDRPQGLADDMGAYESESNGTIIITKQTAPANQGDFDFTHNITTTNTFTLAGGQSETFLNVAPGTYTVTEAIEPFWRLANVRCDDDASARPSSGSTITRTATIELDPGETVTCTFTNSEDDVIIVQKLTTPPFGAGFDFTMSGDDSASFSLDDGQIEVLDVISGTYTISETDPGPSGYLAAIECVIFGPGPTDETTVTGNLATNSVDLQLTDNGQVAYCIFLNEEFSTVNIYKDATPSDGTDFDFELRGDFIADFQLDDAAPSDDNDSISASQTFTLPRGAYSVAEVNVPSGWVNDGLQCSSTDSHITMSHYYTGSIAYMDVVPGDEIDCTFNNSATGSITITKDADPADDTPFDFSFSDGINRATFSLQDPSDPTESRTDIAPLAYTIVEDPQVGWALDDIECVSANQTSSIDYDDASGTANVDLAPDDDVTCTYKNVETGEIHIRKDVTDGPSGPFEFLHDIDGTYVFELNDGETKVFTNVVPGPHGVMEVLTPSGSGLGNIVCDDGSGTTPSTVDLTVNTATINVEAGETVECVFTNAEPKVRIVESYLVSRVEEGKITGEGSVACYWLTLTTSPFGGSVQVGIGQPTDGQVTVSKSSVTLDSTNWNNLDGTDRSNFVCIRPIDDQIADGGTQLCGDGNSDIIGNGSVVTNKECGDHLDFIPHSIITGTVPGLTTIERLLPDGTSTLADPSLAVLVKDNDTAGVVLTESYGVSDLDEDGTPVHQACYWVTLTSQPTAAVTVTPQPNGQVSVHPTSLVLSSSNWNALGADGNKICIRPVQDSQVEGTPNQICAGKKVDLYGTGAVDTQVCGSHLGAVAHSFSSSDANYNGAGVPVSGNGPDLGNNGAGTIDVLIRDDESAGLIFNPTALNVLEGGVAQYNVRLSSQPTGNVSVAAQTSSVSAAGVDATTLTFTPTDWNVAQTLSVTLPDDNDVNGIRTGGISHGVSSGDGHYNGLSGAAVTLPMTITDDDSASAVLSRGSVAVAEGGAGDTYAVRLTMQPTADVVVTVDGGGQVTASPGQLTFTPDNWNVEQSVSIAAIDDAVDEGDVSSATIGHTASSSDPAYNGAAIATVLAEVTDNDTAALAVGATAAASIAEGASTSYGVALATQPTGPVQVFVVTDGKTSANPATLTFDASNWNVAQTVTLTGADDDVDNGANVRTSLVTHAAVSGDGAYNGVNDESLRVDVIDNDVAAIRFSEANVRVAKDGQASYSVTLATRPLAPVVVELVPSSGVTVDASCAEASEGVSQCLVFTPENWNVAQTLTLTALTDAPEHIDHLGSSADAGYNGLNARLLVNGEDAPVNPVFLPLVVK